MKNLLYIVASLLLFSLIACKSELQDQLQTPQVSSGLSDGIACEYLELDRVPLYPNELAIEELLLNPDDASDQDINFLLYTLSEAIKPLLLDCKFNEKIVEMANASPLAAASLLDLERQAPQFYDRINENLPKGFSIAEIASQLIYRSPFGGEAEQYDPGIFVPNLEIANTERQPLLSAGLAYLGNEIPLENAILSTYHEGSGKFKETWLGENVADVTTNPVFVVDLLQQLQKAPGSSDAPIRNNSSVSRSQICPDQYRITNYAIAHRYERDNRSEYWYAVTFILDNGSIAQGGGDEIKKIHKNDINQTHYDVSNVGQMCPNYSNTVRIALVTFERDKFHSVKDVFVEGIRFQLNMKFSSEWYQRIAFDVDGSDYTEYTKGFVGLESTAFCDDCPPGYTFDGAHCHSGMGAPPGYFTFIWGNSFYAAENCSISPLNDCCPSGFGWDSANCHSGIAIPNGWQPFIWQNNFYVHPKCL